MLGKKYAGACLKSSAQQVLVTITKVNSDTSS